MKHCPRCGSGNTRPHTYKPPRKHPDNRIACTPECERIGLFCRQCRTVT